MSKSSIFVAGRIEFLGKHTDYCGGRSLVCAIDKGFSINFVRNHSKLVNLVNNDSDEVITFPLDENLQVRDNHWAKYPQTAVKRIANNFKSRELYGVDIEFSSNLPMAAGVSSSSAFIVGIFDAISKANKLSEFIEYKRNIADKFALGNYLGCIENGYDFGELKGTKGVGTFGGSQDQTAIICCKSNHLSCFSFCPVRHEGDIKLPENLVFVIASSGVIAEKTGDAKEKYNRLSAMSQEIAAKFHKDLSLAQVVEKYGFGAVKESLDREDLVSRLTQFYAESYEIIPQVSEYLANDETAKIGELIDKSHRNADEMLGNQTPETNYLQENARALGAIAASAFGAGFGGSVYALVEKETAEQFLEKWHENYANKFPNLKSEFFITKASESRFS